LKIGAIFPTTEIGTDPALIRDWVQTAEGLGYARVVTYDHVLGAVHEGRTPPMAGPYTEKDAFHEPFVLLAYLAALTANIELMTGILILPQRQTALVAKQAAELSLLSGGRFRLGVGSGWNRVEYESLGVPFAGRGRRLDEQVDLLRRLWREPIVDFAGDFHRVDRAGLLPRPAADIPIWFGGYTPVALSRAAREGDGFLFGSTPRRMAALLGRLREEIRSAGRDPAGFGADAQIDFCQTPDEWREEIAAWREAGGSHVSLRAMDTAAEFVGSRRVGYAGPGDYVRALETFMRAVRAA
jgi:probable F420-dependent oxidoreductase